MTVIHPPPSSNSGPASARPSPVCEGGPSRLSCSPRSPSIRASPGTISPSEPKRVCAADTRQRGHTACRPDAFPHRTQRITPPPRPKRAGVQQAPEVAALLDDRQVLPPHVLREGEEGHLFVVHVRHEAADGVESGEPRGAPAALTRDDPEGAGAVLRPHQDGFEDAARRLDAAGELLERVLAEYRPGLVGVRLDLVQHDLPHLLHQPPSSTISTARRNQPSATPTPRRLRCRRARGTALRA